MQTALSASPGVSVAAARHPEKTSRDPAEWLDMREAVVYALELLRVKVVFVDEAQHLMYRVECPECQALRQITPRSGVLRFPSHDKRKTRRTQTERRWVRQPQGWEVVSGRYT